MTLQDSREKLKSLSAAKVVTQENKEEKHFEFSLPSVVSVY